ncbi:MULTISPECIES: class I SAM-dependent methyltransferase [Bacillus]|uniref:Methyltransferase type 11 domain-containing protein n=2 Tax=Bacillus TaxID=1386 RepID=A0A0M4G843_9BACI|nr:MULTISPECIES: class I SAM-dependent methyltransferase [Bacillus]ALC81320.1 hypothetical protein AM592_06715 [Bacillus gobiensis]MBP1080331.1 SAM-dependent methyltransferase [Bacillus capparidis]MED1094193.1 class I SAM-dependent methyltransferase [Bacillus capparidis]
MSAYLKMLAELGIGGAHPGGLPLTKALIQALRLNPELPILDAGCGTGQTAAYLKQLSFPVIALEPNLLMADKAAVRFEMKGLSIPIYHEKIEQTTFGDDTFSYILTESVLSFTDLRQSAAEIQRILKPDGILIAIEATRTAELTSIEKNEIKDFYDFHDVYSKGEWIAALKNAGFAEVNVINWKNLVLETQETEMNLSPSITEASYHILDQHNRILQKYRGRMGHLIFTASIK